MKIEWYVSLDLSGCEWRDEMEIPDEELAGLSEAEQDEEIENYAKEQAFQHVEWGWKRL